MSTPSWEDLQKRDTAPPADELFVKLCTQVFSTASGKALLAELRRKHIDRPMNPIADERALRVAATEHRFVRDLELTVERGLKAASKVLTQ